MIKLKLANYKKNRVEKLDYIITGVNIGRAHKMFIEAHNLNLSALVRDVISALMTQDSGGKNEKK